MTAAHLLGVFLGCYLGAVALIIIFQFIIDQEQ